MGQKEQGQDQRKSAELREQTADIVDDSLGQAHAKVGQIRDDVRDTTGELEQRAQAVFGEQSERLSSAVKAGGKALRDLKD